MAVVDAGKWNGEGKTEGDRALSKYNTVFQILIVAIPVIACLEENYGHRSKYTEWKIGAVLSYL